MESKDELKEIDIKNCIYYYFDDIMKVTDIDSQKMFLDEKDIKIFKITAFHTKPFRIWFDKIHGFIIIYDVTRYLVILGPSWFDEICNSIKYLTNEKKKVLQIPLIIILQ